MKNNMTSAMTSLMQNLPATKKEGEDQFKKNDVKEVYTLDGHIE